MYIFQKDKLKIYKLYLNGIFKSEMMTSQNAI